MFKTYITVPEFDREPNLVCEDESKKRQRTEELDECFGPNEQPLLQSLEFKVNKLIMWVRFICI